MLEIVAGFDHHMQQAPRFEFAHDGLGPDSLGHFIHPLAEHAAQLFSVSGVATLILHVLHLDVLAYAMSRLDTIGELEQLVGEVPAVATFDLAVEHLSGVAILCQQL